MYKPKQGKGKALAGLIALGILVSGIPAQAEANPLFSLRGLFTGISLGWKLRDWHDELQMNEAHADSTVHQGYQAPIQHRTLVLEIPPVSESICSEVIVYIRDLNTNDLQQIAQKTLSVPPSPYYKHLEIPLPVLTQQGYFQFEAFIPTLPHAIYVEGTQPVLLL